MSYSTCLAPMDYNLLEGEIEDCLASMTSKNGT